MSTTVIANHPALGGDVTKRPSSLRTTPIRLPKPTAQLGLLMNAAVAGKSVVTVAGVRVKNLTVRDPSSDNTTSPGDFVVKGIIDLFGNKDITAELDIWHGSPPLGVTIGPTAPSVQRAIVKGAVRLSHLIPSLRQTSLGADLSLQNISISRQNYLYDPTKSLGYNLDADLIIDSSLRSLSSILSKILAIDEHIVHVHADLGPDHSWNDATNVKSLTIEGSFVGRTYTATPGVQITTIGVRLLLSHGTCDAEVFGRLNLTLPSGGVLPMELDYTLKEVDGAVQLAASLPSGVSWVNPLGVQGFVLNPVTFSSSLPFTDPWKGLTLQIAAKFQYQASVINFTGSYVPSGGVSLQANIRGFNLSLLQQLYEAVHREPLKAPNVDMTVDSADLTISSAKGFSATLTSINIAGYGSGNADLSLSSTGCVIRAELGTVHFGDVTVNSAFIELDLKPASSSKTSDAFIYGDIKFEALEADVAVHLYSSAPNVVPKRTEWTVYAELSSSDNSLALSKIEPRLKGTDFDLVLKNVVFTAASRDDPVVGAVMRGAYKPRQGIQVFATFDEIHAFNSLAKANVTGLVLDASWSRATGFSLDVLLPVARHLSLGKGITTSPVTLTLDLVPSLIDKAKLIPSLQVSAGLYIPVAHSPTPLLLQMVLTATKTNAMVAAELKGNWVNPFGISDQVCIGPDLFLQADLNYATGLQGALFRGGLAVGKTTAEVIVSVNEDPLKEMLYTEIHKLNFADVVSFAERLLRLKLPPPPSDFLEFDTVKLTICPVPLIIQGVSYPAGFSFTSNMVIFGKHADVSCEANEMHLSISGSVENFEIGPLKVSGLDGAPRAALQVQIGKDTLYLLLEGAMTLYGETCTLKVLVNTHPSPEISFKTELKFAELLTFEVDARLIGELNFKELGKADFTFNASLEEHHVGWIHDELFKVFSKAQHAVEEGVHAAKEQVAKEQAKLDDGITHAKLELNAAKEKWDAHRNSITEANQKFIDGYDAKIQSLENAIMGAKKTYDTAIHNAQTDVTNAQHDRHVKMQAAVNDLENSKRKVISDIENAKRQVATAEANLHHNFGSAESSVEDAKHKVQGLQSEINNINREIDSLRHASFWKRAKIVLLEIEKGGIEVALKTAELALNAAEAVLVSADYISHKTAFAVAQKTLDLAESAGAALISDFEKALTEIDHVTQVVVEKAFAALQAVLQGIEKIALDGAVAALEAYKRVNDALLEAANKAIAGIIQCVEYVAFETAMAALAVAQGATKALSAAQSVLSLAEAVGEEVLSIGKAIINAGDDLLSITSVHLSGSLGKSVGGIGLKADVKGFVLKRPFEIQLEFNPSKMEHFLRDMFHELTAHIKKELHI